MRKIDNDKLIDFSCLSNCAAQKAGTRSRLQSRVHRPARIALPDVQWLIVILALTQCRFIKPCSNYQIDKSFDVSLKRLVVHSVGEDRDGFEHFESMLVDALIDQRIDALAASAQCDASVSPDIDFVTDVAQAFGADGVLVTRLKAIDSKLVVKSESKLNAATAGQRSINDALTDSTATPSGDSELALQFSALLSTELFLMADGRMIWSLETASLPHVSRSEILQDSVTAIVEQLQHDNLLNRGN